MNRPRKANKPMKTFFAQAVKEMKTAGLHYANWMTGIFLGSNLLVGIFYPADVCHWFLQESPLTFGGVHMPGYIVAFGEWSLIMFAFNVVLPFLTWLFSWGLWIYLRLSRYLKRISPHGLWPGS